MAANGQDSELNAWRGLTVRLFQALADSRDGRAADAERHNAEQAVQQAGRQQVSSSLRH